MSKDRRRHNSKRHVVKDTFIYYDVIGSHERREDRGLFDALLNEVEWELPKMRGTPISRLSATQGQLSEDGSMPIYRYPIDVLLAVNPFSKTVLMIRDKLHQVLGQDLRLNHVLIQLYRNGRDHITPHSDKTLDIARNSKVINYTIGESRRMVFTKKDPTPDNNHNNHNCHDKEDEASVWLIDDSALVLGPKTNRDYMHCIPRDSETRGQRISLTFRNITTFLSADNTRVVGQGAGPTGVLTVDDSYRARMNLVYKFGLDNTQDSRAFDWDQTYGSGSGYTFESSSRGRASRNPESDQGSPDSAARVPPAEPTGPPKPSLAPVRLPQESNLETPASSPCPSC